MQQNEPTGVTVVVPTLNRGEGILPALDTVLAQTHRPIEILIVEQSDEVCPEVSAFAAANEGIVSLHHVRFRGLPRARNYAWQHARYEALVYIDDDVLCEPVLVAEHLRALSTEGVGMVAGAVDDAVRLPMAVEPRMLFRPSDASAVGDFSQHEDQDAEHVRGGNFGVWRSVLQRLGGFDEELGRSSALYEEVEFCLRAREAGYRIVFRAAARLQHLCAPAGGCKVRTRAEFVWGLARNRTLVIRRHIKGGRRLKPLLLQAKQCGGFAYLDRDPRVFFRGLAGMASGWRQGARAPVCTRIEGAPHASAGLAGRR